MEFVWIVITLIAFVSPIFVSQLLVQHALEKKGNWLKFVELLNGICAFIAGMALLYVFVIGAGRLWDRSGWAFLVSAGTLAFVIYFYLAKTDAVESEKRMGEFTPKQAEKIVQQYGAALARGCPEGHIARPETFLPCPKEKIKQAFKLVLAFEVEHKSLTQENAGQLLGAIMYLDSFVPDDKADRINQGAGSPLQPNTEYWDFTSTMVSIEIRREMDEFIEQVQDLDADDPLFHQRIYTLIGLPYSPRIEKSYWDIFDA